MDTLTTLFISERHNTKRLQERRCIEMTYLSITHTYLHFNK